MVDEAEAAGERPEPIVGWAVRPSGLVGARGEPATDASGSALLPADLAAEMLAHGREGYPLEACGIVAGDRPWSEGGRPLRFYPTRNALASALRYEIDPQEQYRILVAIDDRDEALWGIFHSHTHSAAEPSPTDRRHADGFRALYGPGTLYLIASLADPQDLHLRAWLLDGDEAREVPLRVG